MAVHDTFMEEPVEQFRAIMALLFTGTCIKKKENCLHIGCFKCFLGLAKNGHLVRFKNCLLSQKDPQIHILMLMV